MPRLRDVDPDALGPYLRQHRENPVDWYTWDDDAFEIARSSDRPILLSVGYSSCHWCHVMAHESFEDEATAAEMNRHFVNIKVDREERPDVDAIYMQAVVATNGRGGWPMTVFLDPEGRPFYGGTYFPPTDRQGMPSFGRVLAAMRDVWTTKRSEVREQADAFQAALAQALVLRPNDAADGADIGGDAAGVDAAFLDHAVQTAVAQYDPRFGGFGAAPKFPQAMTLHFLAEQYVRRPTPAVLDTITGSLHAMADGGIHDQLGGGFARYSVDERWLVPHFEKMLYDQALLLRAYTDGWLLTRDERFADVAAGIVTYVLRDLLQPGGGFAAAEDADSGGVEGAFYCWSVAEIRAVCGADAEAVIDFFGVRPEGNFADPHTGFTGSILFRPHRGRTPDDAVLRAVPKMLATRSVRTRPGLDDKVLLGWNALFTRSLLEAVAAFDRDDWHAAAVVNLRFLLTMRDDAGHRCRSWQRGHARHPALAEDHGALLEALVAFAELDNPAWLDDARQVAGELHERFANPDGGFFTTPVDAPALIVRAMDTEDNATPAANSLIAHGLLRLAALTGDDSFAAWARPLVEQLADASARHPTAFAYLLGAVDRAVGPTTEVAIIGPSEAPATRALRDVVTTRLWPGLVMLTTAGPGGSGPLLEERDLVAGAPAAYVCEHFTCHRPVTAAESLAAELEAAVTRDASDSRGAARVNRAPR